MAHDGSRPAVELSAAELQFLLLRPGPFRDGSPLQDRRPGKPPENALLIYFARILVAKPASTFAEYALADSPEYLEISKDRKAGAEGIVLLAKGFSP